MDFNILVAMMVVLSGASAALIGFGIASMLTPLLGVELGIKLAAVAVSIVPMPRNLIRNRFLILALVAI